MPLVKSLDLPGGMGQHFFFDAGNGDCVAFFWFAQAPDGVPGISAPAAIPGIGEIVSAVGSLNHLAFHVPVEKFDEYRRRLKEKGVRVGPTWTSISDFLQRFGNFYQSGAHHGLTPIIAAAASHHRLMWIHPFLDGNGRVVRLYTDAAFRKIPLLGYGLWNVSRGLARSRDGYMASLSGADAPRRHDYDGRGNLSNEGLTQFCRFFLDVCLDQISYMNTLLILDGLLDRLRGYVQLRSAKVLPGPTPSAGALKPEAAFMLQEVLLRGEVARGDLARVSGLADRTARLIIAQLLEEKILVSDMPKGPVRLEFPTHLAGYLFPDLFPVQLRSPI
jgi:Fic family protein